MSDYVTVYLKGPWGPNSKDKDKGYLATRDKGANTICLCDRNDWRGPWRSYPLDNIARIEGDS